MEDAACVAFNGDCPQLKNWLLFGVFDGHGGTNSFSISTVFYNVLINAVWFNTVR